MARIRSIKPEFFTSEDVSALPLRARLTWIGLWTHCDDHGRAKDNVKLIKAAVWPLDDVSLRDVEDDLTALAEAGRIIRYEAAGGRFLAVVKWHDHQAINRPKDSKHPAPHAPGVCSHGGVSDPSVTPHGAVTPGGEGRGREQGGDARGAEPPLRCPKHEGSSDDPPCRACGTARRVHDSWVRAQKARPTPVPGPGDEPRCPVPEHGSELARNCRLCASERKAAS